MWQVILFSAFVYYDIYGVHALQGADYAPVGEYPYLVRISDKGEYFCTGIVLNDSWILTSADCLTDNHGVRLPTDDMSVSQGPGEKYVVANSKIHEEYNYETGTENIALLRLKTPLTFDLIQPAVIATDINDVYSYESCAMVHAVQGDSYYDASADIIGLQECRELHENKKLILKEERHVCSYSKERKYIACQSGCMGTTLVCGPLDRRIVFGILNFKREIEDECENPEVYTLFSGFNNWTEQGKAGFCCLGIKNDLDATQSIRMRGTTGKVVTVIDILVIAIVAGSAVVVGPSMVKHVNKLKRIHQEVDTCLGAASDWRSKHRAWCLLGGVHGGLLITISLDIWAWHRIGNKLYGDASAVRGYIPFYLLYFFVGQLHVQYAHTVLGLGQRFRTLNKKLLEFTRTDDVGHGISIVRKENKDWVQHKPYYINKAVDTWMALNITDKHSTSELLQNLSHCYGLLSDGVEIVSEAHGPPLLCALSSCLYHLIATAYFLLIEVAGDRDPLFSYLQTMWVAVHFIRLLLIVEPCNFTLVEIQRINTTVCRLLEKIYDSNTRKQVKLFSSTLLHRKIVFPICGLCFMDRSIITTISGSIATYLVILLQFKKSEG